MRMPNETCRLAIATLSLCMLGSLLAQPLWAQKKAYPFKLEASVGGQYDSNITVDEIDVNSTRDDVAVLLNINADYKRPLSTNLNLNAGYSLSQSLHNDLDQFDIQTHLLSVGLTFDIDNKTSTGLNYNYADSALNGNDFINLTQLSPYLSYYFSKQIFVRSALSFTDKNFDGRSSRDADAWALNVDLYYFINGPRHYLIGGFRYRDEDAVSAPFDYDGYQLKLRWINRLRFLDRQSKLKLGWRFEQRNYDDISSAAGQRREDSRHRWSADLELPLGEKTALLFEHEYRDYESNLDSGDYIEHVTNIRLRHRFF